VDGTAVHVKQATPLLISPVAIAGVIILIPDIIVVSANVLFFNDRGLFAGAAHFLGEEIGGVKLTAIVEVVGVESAAVTVIICDSIVSVFAERFGLDFFSCFEGTLASEVLLWRLRVTVEGPALMACLTSWTSPSGITFRLVKLYFLVEEELALVASARCILRLPIFSNGPTPGAANLVVVIARARRVAKIVWAVEPPGTATFLSERVLLWGNRDLVGDCALCLKAVGFGKSERSNENSNGFHFDVCVKFGFDYNLD